MRYAFRTFARYRSVRKVTTFGSARTAETEPTYRQAEEFAKRVVEAGFMLITGAGGGHYGACQAGLAGPTASESTSACRSSNGRTNSSPTTPKLVTFKYFFTRKLLFIRKRPTRS